MDDSPGRVEIRILAAIVAEAPGSGLITNTILDNGIPGVATPDLASGCRNLLQSGLVKRREIGLQLTDKGWAWVESYRFDVALQSTRRSSIQVTKPSGFWAAIRRLQQRRVH